MTDDRSLERAARSWLEVGPTQAPPSAVDAALLRIETTRQERDLRIPWRFTAMPMPARVAVAAVIGVLLIGGAFYFLSPSTRSNVGGPGPSPSILPSPSPSSAVLPPISPADVGKPLGAGPYRVGDFAAPFSVTLPADWTVSEFTPNSITIARRADASVNLYMAVVRKAYADPCHPSSGPKVIGSDVDGLVAALSSMPGFDMADVRDAAVGGAVGKSFTFGNAIDVAAAGCSDNRLPMMTYENHGTDVDVSMFAGESDRFWVLDAGGTRVFLAVTDSNVAATQPLLDSLSFGD